MIIDFLKSKIFNKNATLDKSPATNNNNNKQSKTLLPESRDNSTFDTDISSQDKAQFMKDLSKMKYQIDTHTGLTRNRRRI